MRTSSGHNLIINLSLYSIPDVTTCDSHHSSVTLTLVEQQCTAVSGAYYNYKVWPLAGSGAERERSASISISVSGCIA